MDNNEKNKNNQTPRRRVTRDQLTPEQLANHKLKKRIIRLNEKMSKLNTLAIYMNSTASQRGEKGFTANEMKLYADKMSDIIEGKA